MTTSPIASDWKFRPINEFTFAMLINSELWFAHPSTFNDPFDCDPVFTLSTNYIKENINGPWTYVRDNDAFLAGLREENANLNRGYFCTCHEWEHTLMWSHYASNHTGIALGFSGQLIETEEFLEQNMVSYQSDEINEAVTKYRHMLELAILRKHSEPSDKVNIDAALLKALFEKRNFFNVARRTKAECWSYEHESRYSIPLQTENKRGKAVKFLPSSLKHVIFGLKCSEQNQTTIRNLLSTKSWEHVQFWNAARDLEKMLITAIPSDKTAPEANA